MSTVHVLCTGTHVKSSGGGSMGESLLIYWVTFNPNKKCCIMLSLGGARPAKVADSFWHAASMVCGKGKFQHQQPSQQKSKCEWETTDHSKKQQDLKTFWWVFPNLVLLGSLWKTSKSHRLRWAAATVRTKNLSAYFVSLAVRFWYNFGVYLVIRASGSVYVRPCVCMCSWELALCCV